MAQRKITSHRTRACAWIGAAGMALFALVAAPASAAPPARALYVADGIMGGAGSIGQFAVSMPGGMPSALNPPEVPTGGDPQHLALSPDGRHAYATAAEPGLLYSYRVRRDGRLKALHGDPVAAGTGAHGVAVAPDGSSVYAASQDSGTVAQYDVRARGALVPKEPATVGSGAGASGVAVAPDGRSVYVTNLNQASVSQYDVDRASGALTPKEPATVPAPPMPGGVGVSPDGRALYVAALSGHLAQFRINSATGRLRPMSPATVPVGIGAAGIAITPNGRFLYTPDGGTDAVSQFSINPRHGELTPLTPASVSAGDRPEGAGVTPDGRSLYVANAEAGTLSWFTIDGRTGLLAAADPGSIATGPGPHGVAVTPDQGPRARFGIRGGSRIVRPGERVRFNAAGSRDRDGAIARYSWRFGDGTALRRGRAAAAHRYRKPGRYRVRLRVTDDERCSNRRSYTGATMSCNGGPKAVAVRKVKVLRKGEPATTAGSTGRSGRSRPGRDPMRLEESLILWPATGPTIEVD